ncbi:MAG: hypothetical protein ACKVOH_06745 [Chlamydiales bacterium]
MKKGFLLTAFFFIASLQADPLNVDLPEIWDTNCSAPCTPVTPCPLPVGTERIEAHFLNPHYCDGVLTTDQGGVLTGKELHIQARKFVYTRKMDATPPLCSVYCEGDLFIDFKGWVLTADAIFYDFISETGYLLNGKTASPPWFVGGKEMQIGPGGKLRVLDGYITTSEGKDQRDLLILTRDLVLNQNQIASAKGVHFKLFDNTLFWLPYMKLNLNKRLNRSPFAIKFGWGRYLDSHVSLLYNFLNYNDLKGTARLDGFFKHGLGAGIDTFYNPKWRYTEFYTRNYWAHDLAIDDPQTRDRYRFAGTFFDRYFYDTLSVKALYDFVSDGQMAYDFRTRDYDLKTAGDTCLNIRHENPKWIANLFSRVQVNSFQSVNQELPSFYLHLHPYEIPSTGVVVESDLSAAYLDYVFSDDVSPRRNFHGGRIATTPNIYRPFAVGPVTATPLAGLIGIYYTNSPGRGDVGQLLGKFGCSLETEASRTFGCVRHIMEPYVHYTYLTKPRVSLPDHYIFSIADGWNQLNQIRFGWKNSFFLKSKRGIHRFFWYDIWANAFLGASTLPNAIPTGFFDCEIRPIRPLSFNLVSGYSFAFHNPYYLNAHLDWTFSEHFAVGFGYHGRSRYYIRKADFYNFILDVTRSPASILASPLSDRRQTFLFRTFVRPTPDLTAEFDLRRGWDRPNQPTYLEYMLNLGTVLFQHWRFNFIIEHREADMRYSLSLKLDPGAPSKGKFCR